MLMSSKTRETHAVFAIFVDNFESQGAPLLLLLSFMIEYNPPQSYTSTCTMKQFVLFLAFIFSVETALASRQSTLVSALNKQRHTAFIRPEHETLQFADGDEESTAFVRQCVDKDSANQNQKRFTRKQMQQPELKETNNGAPFGKKKVKVASAASTADISTAKNPIIQFGEYMPLYTGY